jgi:hypothetical protein
MEYVICDYCGGLEEAIVAGWSLLGTPVMKVFRADERLHNTVLCSLCAPPTFADGSPNPNFNYGRKYGVRKHITEVVKDAKFMKKVLNYDKKRDYRKLTFMRYLKTKGLI